MSQVGEKEIEIPEKYYLEWKERADDWTPKSPGNTKYCEKMSELLDALILQRKQEALDYKSSLFKEKNVYNV